MSAPITITLTDDRWKALTHEAKEGAWSQARHMDNSSWDSDTIAIAAMKAVREQIEKWAEEQERGEGT